jgi:formamidopyrimidine-DNA glycosylase
MPELAEVEYYRKTWDCGLGATILRTAIRHRKRVFRGVDRRQLQDRLTGSVLLSSRVKGKQLLFEFSECWLGIHLGMTGKLRVEEPSFRPGPHDHLVLYQPERSLIFSDPRLFGRIRFSQDASEPDWWTALPPSVHSGEITRRLMERFLARHPKLSIKTALLLQSGFAGIGNWMADEILWRARVNPKRASGSLSPDELGAIWKQLRWVCQGAMKHIGRDFSDPPKGWLFHERWRNDGHCPVHPQSRLERQKIGGRTTAWCSRCQPPKSNSSVRPGASSARPG